MNLNRRLIRQADIARFALVLSVLAGFLGGLAAVLQARQVSAVVAGVFLEEETLNDVLPALRLLLVAVILRAALGFASETASLAVARRVKDRLRGLLARKMFALGPLHARDESSGSLLHAAVQAVDALDAYFSQYLPQLALAGMLPLAYLLIVLRIDPLSALVLAITGPLIPVFMFLIGGAGETLTRRQYGALRRMSAYFLDTIQGLTTLKALGRSRDQRYRIVEISDRYRETTMQVLRLTFLSALALELLGTMGTALIAVQTGLRLLYGQMQFEQAFFLLLLAPDFYLPLRNLGLRFHAGMAGVSAARQIFALLDEPELETPSGQQTVDLHAPFTITLRSVSYTYPGRDEPALADVSLDLHSGEIVALVGRSGAGKTTLAELLLRFIQTQSGAISVNGLPLAALDIDHWRAQVAWVSQQPYLLHGALSDNLRVAKSDATQRDLFAAVTAARLDDFVSTLPDGLDTQVGEGALRLSGGQAQRLALARAYLRDAPFLIMDEPTAHMDVEGEAALLETTHRLLAGRAALVIAHRRSTVMQADRVVVMEAGRIVEVGQPAALAAAGGPFARLFSLQEDSR